MTCRATLLRVGQTWSYWPAKLTYVVAQSRGADQAFPKVSVIYVHGNREAYGQKMDTLKQKLAEACLGTSHIHLLDKGELVIGNVRFLGTTLWTDFHSLGPDSVHEAVRTATAVMNDYRKIRSAKAGYRRIKLRDVAKWHWEYRRVRLRAAA